MQNNYNFTASVHGMWWANLTVAASLPMVAAYCCAKLNIVPISCSDWANVLLTTRNPELVEHSLESLIKQRIYTLALDYEYLNDHDDL